MPTTTAAYRSQAAGGQVVVAEQVDPVAQGPQGGRDVIP